MENIRNSGEIGEKELLAVSFGTSYPKNRRQTIGAIEDALEQAFPDWSVRRAFTSKKVIANIKKKENLSIDSLAEALERAKENGVKRLVLQPTLMMDGIEYQELLAQVQKEQQAFERLTVGRPLLDEEADFRQIVQILTEQTGQYEDGKTAICFMGHGTTVKANCVYEKLQQMLFDCGYRNYLIGTVEAEPNLTQLRKKVKDAGYARVILQPLMIVAGDHANHDMAGDGEDSWKSAFEADGCEVVCILKGLGEIPMIQNLFVAHAKRAIENGSLQ